MHGYPRPRIETVFDPFVLNPRVAGGRGPALAIPNSIGRLAFNLEFGKTFNQGLYASAASVNFGSIEESVDNVVPRAVRLRPTATGSVYCCKLWPLPTAADVDLVLHSTGPEGEAGQAVGLILSDTNTAASGNQHIAFTYYNSGTTNRNRSAYRYTNFGTFQAALVAESEWQYPLYFTRIRRLAAQWQALWSHDGRLWEGPYNFTPTGTPSYFGFTLHNAAVRAAAFYSLRAWVHAMPRDAIGVERWIADVGHR